MTTEEVDRLSQLRTTPPFHVGRYHDLFQVEEVEWDWMGGKVSEGRRGEEEEEEGDHWSLKSSTKFANGLYEGAEERLGILWKEMKEEVEKKKEKKKEEEGKEEEEEEEEEGWDAMFIRKKMFLLDSSVVYLNHGSYGASLVEGIETQRRWQERMER
jgi:hypothetical protein